MNANLAEIHQGSLSGTLGLQHLLVDDPKQARISLRSVGTVVVDAALLLGAALVTSAYYSTSPISWSLVAAALVTTVWWLVMLNVCNAYNSKISIPVYQRVYDLLKAGAFSILATSATYYLFPTLSVSRPILWGSALLGGAGILLWRTTFFTFFYTPLAQRRVAVIGSAANHAELADMLQIHPKCGYRVATFIDVEQLNAGSLHNFGYASLKDLLQSSRIDSVVLAVRENLSDTTLRSLADCVESGYEVISTPKLYERVHSTVPLHHINHWWFIYEIDEANRRGYFVSKRMLDICLALLGLCATFLIFPILALLIKLDSPGPALYSQVRVGKNGQLFRIFKFRTMVQDAERSGAVWARLNDTRVTRLGNFLRRTRLDELPQLFNVLIGDMSLVGPRPERPEFVESLAAEIPFFQRRQMVLPGLTGWAQVNFPYGASVEDARQKLQYDLFYIKNRSIFLDLEIIVRTISVVIKKTGAR